MIRLIDKQKIILKHREGVSNRQIAIDLDIDKNTVNKYVRQYENEMKKLYEQDPNTENAVLPSSITETPHYDASNRTVQEKTRKAEVIIQECLKDNEIKRETGRSKQQMRKTDICRYLQETHHLNISYSTVRRIVAGLEGTRKEAYIRQEHSPGMETEFDWGEIKLNIGGQGYKRYQMAVFTSAYGNHRFAMLFRTQDTAAFQESHVEYFTFCGGVYRTVTYDNMKVAVKKFVGPSEKEPTQALLELSMYYGFRWRFCNVRRGNEKGHVERSVDVIRHYAFAEIGNDCFDSLEEANRHLLNKCRDLNRKALSDGRIPQETYEEERAVLLTAPPKMACFIKKCNLKVDKYSTIVVNNVHYSVPDNLAGKRLNAWVYTGRIEVFKGNDQVASHERHYRQGEYVLDIFHYLHTLKKKPGAFPQSSALLQADTTIKNLYEKYYTTEPKEFLQILELIQEHGLETVEKAIEFLTKTSPLDLSAEKVKMSCRKNLPVAIPDHYGSDRLSKKSKQTLSDYDQLRMMQSRRAC